MMDEIDVERIARLRKVELFSVRTVVIRLQLNVGPRTQDSLPTTQQVATGKLRILLHIGHKRLRVTCDPHTLSGITVIEVTLKRELVAIVSIPIRPESGLAHPPVIELFLIGMEQAGFRSDWDRNDRDKFTLQGDLYNGDTGQTVGITSYSPPFMTNVQQNAELA